MKTHIIALWQRVLTLGMVCALPLLATSSGKSPSQNLVDSFGALSNEQLMLSDEQFKTIENKRVDIIDIMRAHERDIRDKSTEEKILYYQHLLEANHIPVRSMPYKSQDYIEARFIDEPESKRMKHAKSYSIADRKSGAFSGVMLGVANLTQNYQDGLYNRINNVPKDEAGFVCTDTDKSGCKISGIFHNGEQGIDFVSNLFAFGGGFGYQRFFNPFLGTRLYGDGLLSAGTERIGEEAVGSFYYVLGGMNVDVLAELPFSIFGTLGENRVLKDMAVGLYGGLSIGVLLFFDQANENLAKYTNGLTSKDVLWNYLLQVDYGFNLGASFSLTSRYKLDFGAKIPMSAVGLPSELRLGLESTASYSNGESIVSKDIVITRTPFWYASFIMLF